jgi:hypothetical protein
MFVLSFFHIFLKFLNVFLLSAVTLAAPYTQYSLPQPVPAATPAPPADVPTAPRQQPYTAPSSTPAQDVVSTSAAPQAQPMSSSTTPLPVIVIIEGEFF